ncbi:hypothetical protein [Bradyrhizobium sp. JYMT SZCCT0428]|uniref:hypothetical protein n=1 Tax=Bradyrhizobium sp. JYMT SZCCT0428 TaxID=2807673 RepID=UPI001BAC1352|nr:hypothetical protein [Bradyrhizobium sp. JYMT SZCCT0428]MBR1156200.1 hypothetical protein [Bradyrhizobium sp. JYMT SZCCT0428]
MDEIERYRRNAEMSLEQAKLARTDHDRDAWLKLAAEWSEMAVVKERRSVAARHSR